MKFAGIVYQRLPFYRQYFDDPTVGIPNKSGIYYWTYWPDFDANSVSSQDVLKIIHSYTKNFLNFSETAKGVYKFEAIISEQWYPQNGELFGLSPAKARKLKHFLMSRENIEFFFTFFKEMCLARPFYVGKAKNLRSRLKSHFNENTETIPQIKSNGIPEGHIWIGYKEVKDPSDDNMSNIFEEVFSRRMKPGLTKKHN